MEKEPFEDLGLIAEVSSHEHEGHLTPDQREHLETWDVKIAIWMEEMRKAEDKQRAFKEYVSRTHDYKNYDSH